MDESKDKQETEQEPEVFAVKRGLEGWQFSRRGFLGAAGAAVAVVAAGCQPEADPADELRLVRPSATPSQTPRPPHTSTPRATRTPRPTSTDTPTRTSTPTRTRRPTSTPTSTPEVTPSITPTRPTPKAIFMKDVTIPDGTNMDPGEEFTKTWQVKNTGEAAWGESIVLVWVDGSQMEGESPSLVDDCDPGELIEISIDLVAPSSPGSFTGWWELETSDGTLMTPLTVIITVIAPGEWGEVPPGETGGTIEGPSGETRWLPCNSPIPPGWVCVCNCVSTPCSCDTYVCSCDSVCTCDAVCSCEEYGHYWYPN